MFKQYRQEIGIFAGIICLMAFFTEQDKVAMVAGLVTSLNYLCYKAGV